MGEFWIRAVAAAAIAYFCGCFNGTMCAPMAAATRG